MMLRWIATIGLIGKVLDFFLALFFSFKWEKHIYIYIKILEIRIEYFHQI
jgi:hypothetical protein